MYGGVRLSDSLNWIRQKANTLWKFDIWSKFERTIVCMYDTKICMYNIIYMYVRECWYSVSTTFFSACLEFHGIFFTFDVIISLSISFPLNLFPHDISHLDGLLGKIRRVLWQHKTWYVTWNSHSIRSVEN